jgi:hypothetical protein
MLERHLLAGAGQDVERLTGLVHPELVACDSHGKLHTRPWLLDLLRPPMAGATVDESVCVVLGPDARLVSSRITAEGIVYQSGAVWVSGASPASWQLRYIQLTRYAP